MWGSAWAEWQQEAGGESLECRAQVMLAEQEQVFKERSLRSGMVQDMVHGPQSQGMMFLKPRVKEEVHRLEWRLVFFTGS